MRCAGFIYKVFEIVLLFKKIFINIAVIEKDDAP